ncbi:MAG: stage III sporulation protein AC [Ruminococcaceae bacterium]|nr:stage III sporulation protein AC [Oscillospiraceae bacterium]
MDVTLILKIAGAGLLVSIAYIILNKAGRDEMAMLVSLAGVIIVLLMIVNELSDLMTTVKTLFGL